VRYLNDFSKNATTGRLSRWTGKAVLMLALLAGSVNGVAQNLVANGSFEEGIECPSFIGNVDAQCAHWFNSITYPAPSAEDPTPEWYHTCSEADIFTPPDVAFGYQEPFDGEGFVGLAVYNNQDGVEESYREIIGVELVEPLIQGNTYLVEFSIVRMYLDVNGIATNNFGYKFSMQDQVNFDSLIVDNTASFHIDTIVSDTTNWLTVSSEFIADTNYAYLHFGNFFDNESTEFFVDGEYGIYAYYALLDAVSVTEVLSTHNRNRSDINIYPNPAQDRFTIQAPEGIAEYAIYNLSGDLLKSEKGYGKASIESDIAHLPAGVYVLHLTTQTQSYYERVVKL
jgi:hypothetical protein